MKQATGLICILLMSIPAFADPEPGTGVVQGTILAAESNGEKIVVPGAQVRLSGARSLEIQADAAGKYEFSAVQPGDYRIDVSAPGLSGTTSVTVVAGRTLDAPVELEMEVMKFAVTVSDNAETLVTAKSVSQDVISEETLKSAPNKNDRIESMLPMIPGVVRGPDGLINMKGARASQGGSLVNGANVSDPVTGNAAIRLPIDVVAAVEVVSNPYDPEYGKLTGAVSTVDTRTGNYEKFHTSVQNLFVRPRKRDGDFVGIEAATPRMTVTGPLLNDKLAFTQSLEYRYVRTPVSGLPQLQRDTKLESFDSYSQLDWLIDQKQSATASVAVYPQKLDYLGLNTFTPQSATSDLHQRGYMASLQHRYVTGPESLLVSQFSYKRLDADVTGQSDDAYRLLIETTEGGYFNRQHRETYRSEWQETYHFGHMNFLGSHQVKAGFNYVHNSYDGNVRFLPVEIVGASGSMLQRIDFTPASDFNVGQNETAVFVSDQWTPVQRVTINYGVRMDHDSVTESTNFAPRAGVAFGLTKDSKTLLKAGAGLFYDRVALSVPAFPLLPSRTITEFNALGAPLPFTAYSNVLASNIQSPRSAVWNVELDRQLAERLVVRVGYQQRNTSRDLVLTPIKQDESGILSLTNDGLSLYREFQVTGRYRFRRHVMNASYVRSEAFGDLNDYSQFFGNTPAAVIQPNQRGRLPFDAPNRFLFWGEFAAPWKVTLAPALDVHTGFPYSVLNQEREFVGSRDAQRFPQFASVDLQVTKEIPLPMRKKARVGFSVFNLLNQFNPRDVQNNIDSERFGEYFNGVGRTFRGKFVLDF